MAGRQQYIRSGFLTGILLVACISPVPLFAQLKVLVLNFQNSTNHKDYAYLSGSLGEAVKKDLRDNYDFAETPEQEWKLIASENYLSEDDFFTKSVILNLGLLARQDLVISGSYAPIPGAKQQTLLTRVRIADINKKEIIREFEVKLPASSNLFNELKTVTMRIVTELKDILPSKKNYAKSDIGDFSLARDHEWGLRLSYGLFSPRTGDFTQVSSGSQIFPYAISSLIRADLDYRRHNFRRGNFLIGGELSYELSKKTAGTALNTQMTSITEHSIMTNVLLAYEYLFSNRIAFVPAFLMGYSAHIMNRDYSNLTTYPLDPETGRAEPSVTQTALAPDVGVRFDMVYRISGGVSVNAGIANYVLLFLNGIDSRGYVSVGSSMRY